MGLMTEAGRLRLGLTALGKTSNSIIRRFSNLAAPIVTGLEGDFELKTEKSIYLCFLQLINNTRRFENSVVNAKQSVLPINWKWDNSSDYKHGTLVDEVAHKKFKFYNEYSTTCSTYGSRVLLPCGIDTLHMCSLDTSKCPLKIEVLSAQEPHAKCFKNVKHQLILGEVDGKLYRLWNHSEMFDLYPNYSAFQVSDPGDYDFHPISLSWESLHTPPFIRSKEGVPNALFLNSAKKIIGWNKFERRYFCFDTNKPEIGWRYLGDSLPFGGSFYKPFLVNHHHPDFGYFHLMFQYDPSNYQISASFISDNFDTFKPLHTYIKLPADLCYQYIIREGDRGYEEFQYQQPHADHSFVDLGNQRVGLVLHKCVNRDGNGEEPGYVLLVAFEYGIAPYVRNSKPTMDIESVSIKTCLFQYPTKHLREPAGSVWHYKMNGAFLL